MRTGFRKRVEPADLGPTLVDRDGRLARRPGYRLRRRRSEMRSMLLGPSPTTAASPERWSLAGSISEEDLVHLLKRYLPGAGYTTSDDSVPGPGSGVEARPRPAQTELRSTARSLVRDGVRHRCGARPIARASTRASPSRSGRLSRRRSRRGVIWNGPGLGVQRHQGRRRPRQGVRGSRRAAARGSKADAASTNEEAPVVQVVPDGHHPGPARPRLRHPHRAAGRPGARPLPHRRRAARRARPARRRSGPALVSRIKIMADMNIVERRRPQDGQFEIDGRRPRSTSGSPPPPTIWGEKAVLRLLDKSRSLLQLAELGMPPRHARALLAALIRSPFGMVICAGPTGSGKTTTLYALAQRDQQRRAQRHDHRGPGRVRASRRSTRSRSTSRPASRSPAG